MTEKVKRTVGRLLATYLVILLIPIVSMLAVKSKKSMMSFGTVLYSGALVTASLVPPTPGPVSAAALLNVPSSEIENTELMPTILRKESKDDKYGILDVRVKLKDGEQIDFEMQVEAFDCWANRSVYYLSKMYAGEIKEGEGYDCLKKCIHVSILAYDHFPDDKECYRRIAFCDT